MILYEWLHDSTENSKKRYNFSHVDTVFRRFYEKLAEILRLSANFHPLSQGEISETPFSSGDCGGNKFRMDFYRNQLIFVICLSNSDYFLLVLYPNVRKYPLTSRTKERFSVDDFAQKKRLSETLRGRQSIWERFANFTCKTPPYLPIALQNIRDPKKIFPRKNLAVVFYGNRTFHGVIPADKNLESPEFRYSLQFAFDSDH